MNYNKFIKTQVLTLLFASAGCAFTSCEDDIEVGRIDESGYVTSQDVLGYLIDANGKRAISNVEFRNVGTTEIFLNASQKATQNSTATVAYDKAVLDAYNEKQGSTYEAFPIDSVTISNEGLLTLAQGESRSNKLEVTYKTFEGSESQKSYVIPLKITTKSGDLKLTEKESTYLLFVKDLTGIPDCNKASGIKIISCMEVNDTNPLNNLCFTLKNSGKPLVDMLIMFSANINYNAETGRVYVYNNENVQHLLDQRVKYLKPLQDRGMKIILGILGNHDRSGVANLADKTAKAFAQELKAVCDAYHLDGVFFDDEYSNYQNPAPEGFVSPSSTAASRLCYEVKQAMPDRLVCAYAYGLTSSLPSIENQTSGTFVDYGIHDYGNGSDMSSRYPGMPKSGMALYSQEFARGNFTSENNLKSLRDKGYGAHMIFAMDPFRSNLQRQISAMQSIAKVLYDDELVYDGKPYRKDW